MSASIFLNSGICPCPLPPPRFPENPVICPQLLVPPGAGHRESSVFVEWTCTVHVASFSDSSLGIPLSPLLDGSQHLHSLLILDKIDSGFSTSGLISCENIRELKRSLLGTRLCPQQAAHQDADCSGRQDEGSPAAGPARWAAGPRPSPPRPRRPASPSIEASAWPVPWSPALQRPPLLQSFLPFLLRPPHLSRSFSTAFQGVQASLS